MGFDSVGYRAQWKSIQLGKININSIARALELVKPLCFIDVFAILVTNCFNLVEKISSKSSRCFAFSRLFIILYLGNRR